MSSLISLAAEHEHELPMPPLVIGLSIFVFFCVLILGVLMFGKGRPHA